ncbi:MAG: clan AA aspartic protease [Richelia sp. RM2_1_2]|jgi:clan AA aspartic protease|uniref:clan AA aspartic protease n=1 Tax=Rivularia sp. PCC 7116 TaxID=373994 RepID=UPI00029F166C|nr:clan AA aspartic protease [Rivularia sp. PCC 7116]AFY54285.1 clan AA aspartic protease, AF_0612 family [Rivularia sp. PCC 7116]NJO63085.1 clan AA aspartic protease [Richelia sp. RM2_1_2]
MINGTVVGLQAQISVVLCLVEIPNIEIQFVVDTGFEGFLTLPPAAIAKLGLTYLTQINANLANNSNVSTDVFLATILWNGIKRDVTVLAMGRRPLVGTALLQDYHLGIDFREGGTVSVDEIL